MVARPSRLGGRRCLLRLAHVRARHEYRTYRRVCARRRIGGRVRRSSARICGIRERDAALCGSQPGAGIQILKDNEIRRNEIGPRLAPEAVHADTAGTCDGVAYQSLHRTDHQGGQRNLPEGLFVFLKIKRSAGRMKHFSMA
jgi:hypothetical protein